MWKKRNIYSVQNIACHFLINFNRGLYLSLQIKTTMNSKKCLN